ncbi:RNA ligase-domain-containing protein [Zopfochytrium polystomum]|nr:RNA ligase-domain-containing protein [Zopfochytrium polystomum]
MTPRRRGGGGGGGGRPQQQQQHPRPPQPRPAPAASPAVVIGPTSFASVDALKRAEGFSPDALVAALSHLAGGGGRGAKRAVRQTHYFIKPPPPPPSTSSSSSAPAAAAPFVLTSFNCNEFLFKKNPPALPTHARGLFVLRDIADASNNGASGNVIVVRGYDKFFNAGEVRWTSEASLRSSTVGPYEMTLKENGCIIFVAAVHSTLIVTSKHAMDAPVVASLADARPKHAAVGEDWVNRHLKAKGKTREELIAFLEANRVTLVMELVDDDFEEHILEYPPERRGLYLHGINENTVAFETWSSSRVAEVANMFGFRHVDVVVKETFDEVMEMSEACKSTGSYKGVPVEGFVIRARNIDGRVEFWKVKFPDPYLMFREWREVTKAILSGKGERFKPRFELTRKYMNWVSTKSLSDPELFAKYRSEQKGIIRARKLFLKEVCGVEEDDSHTNPEAASDKPGTAKKGGKGKASSAGTTVGGTAAAPPRVVMLLPVSIVGLGKTTLGKALARLLSHGATASSPKINVTHVQSDDAGRKPIFLANVRKATSAAGFQIVYADRCNHLAMHRPELVRAFREGIGAVSGKIVALEWTVKENEARAVQVSTERIGGRGENHQSLTPTKTPQYPTIARRFGTEFTPLNPAEDTGIDVVVKIAVESTVADRVASVCEALGIPAPDAAAVERVMRELVASEAAAAEAAAASAATTSAGPSPASPQQQPQPQQQQKQRPQSSPAPSPVTKPSSSPSSAGKSRVRPVLYYGIRVTNVRTVQDAVATTLEAAAPDVWAALSGSGGSGLRPELHVTLCFLRTHAALGDQYASEFLSRRTAGLSIKGDSGAEWKVTVQATELLYDDRVVALPVGPLPPSLPCGNRHPHVTVALRNAAAKPRMSNDLMVAAFGGSDGDGMGGTPVRLPLGAPLVVEGVVSEFYS